MHKILYRDYYSNKLLSMEVESLNDYQGADIDDLQVLKSAAGFYIGGLYKHMPLNEDSKVWLPSFRDSEKYFKTREEAEEALISGHYLIKS